MAEPIDTPATSKSIVDFTLAFFASLQDPKFTAPSNVDTKLLNSLKGMWGKGGSAKSLNDVTTFLYEDQKGDLAGAMDAYKKAKDAAYASAKSFGDVSPTVLRNLASDPALKPFHGKIEADIKAAGGNKEKLAQVDARIMGMKALIAYTNKLDVPPVKPNEDLKYQAPHNLFEYVGPLLNTEEYKRFLKLKNLIQKQNRKIAEQNKIPDPIINGAVMDLVEKVSDTLALTGKTGVEIAQSLEDSFRNRSLKDGQVVSFEVDGKLLEFTVRHDRSGVIFNPDKDNAIHINPSSMGNYDVQMNAAKLAEFLAKNKIEHVEVAGNAKEQQQNMTNDLQALRSVMGLDGRLVLHDRAGHGNRNYEFKLNPDGKFEFVPNKGNTRSSSNMDDPFRGKAATVEQIAELAIHHKMTGFQAVNLHGAQANVAGKTTTFIARDSNAPSALPKGTLIQFNAGGTMQPSLLGGRLNLSKVEQGPTVTPEQRNNIIEQINGVKPLVPTGP